MPEPRLPVAEVERALADLGGRIEFPPTPALAPAVTSRLLAEREGRVRPPGLAPWSRKRLLVAVALGILALLGIAAAARYVIGAFEIRVVQTPSPATTAPAPSAVGEAIPLEEAREALPFEIRLPARLGEPDLVRLFRSPFGDLAALLAWSDPSLPPVAGTPWNLILIELPGDKGFAAKLVAVPPQPATVRGRDAFWISGRHELVLETDGGTEVYDVRGNVLIWDVGGALALRMETGLSRAGAVALAETIG